MNPVLSVGTVVPTMEQAVIHLVNLFAATFLFYVSVTRGALVFARVLERVVPRR